MNVREMTEEEGQQYEEMRKISIQGTSAMESIDRDMQEDGEDGEVKEKEKEEKKKTRAIHQSKEKKPKKGKKPNRKRKEDDNASSTQNPSKRVRTSTNV